MNDELKSIEHRRDPAKRGRPFFSVRRKPGPTHQELLDDPDWSSWEVLVFEFGGHWITRIGVGLVCLGAWLLTPILGRTGYWFAWAASGFFALYVWWRLLQYVRARAAARAQAASMAEATEAAGSGLSAQHGKRL